MGPNVSGRRADDPCAQCAARAFGRKTGDPLVAIILNPKTVVRDPLPEVPNLPTDTSKRVVGLPLTLPEAALAGEVAREHVDKEKTKQRENLKKQNKSLINSALTLFPDKTISNKMFHKINLDPKSRHEI